MTGGRLMAMLTPQQKRSHYVYEHQLKARAKRYEERPPITLREITAIATAITDELLTVRRNKDAELTCALSIQYHEGQNAPMLKELRGMMKARRQGVWMALASALQHLGRGALAALRGEALSSDDPWTDLDEETRELVTWLVARAADAEARRQRR